MGNITDTGANAFRDYETAGVPASGPHDPVKSEVRATYSVIDTALTLLATANVTVGAVIYPLRSTLYADLAHPAGTPGIVWNDGANNGLFFKSGASGAGSWSATGLLLQGPAGDAGDVANIIAARDAALASIAAVAGSLVDQSYTYGPTDLSGGTAGVNGTTYVDNAPAANSGLLKSISLPASMPAGNYVLYIATKSGSAFTAVFSFAFASAGGAQTINLTAPYFEVIAGTHYRGIAGAGAYAAVYRNTGAGQWYGPPISTATTLLFAAGYEPLFSIGLFQRGLNARVTTLEGEIGNPQPSTGATAVARTPIASADKVTLLTGTALNHSIGAGQSNSEGYNSIPPITTAAPIATNFTFGSGPRSGKSGGSTSGSVNSTPGTSTLIALAENALGADPTYGGSVGESICTGSATHFSVQAAIENGLSPANLRQLVSNVSHGAYGIAGLNKGSAWYAVMTDHIGEGIARAKAAGVDYQMTDIVMEQGEADATSGTSRATYKGLFKQYRADVETDYHTALTAAVGGSILTKSNPIHMFFVQTSTWGDTATLSAIEQIALAQMDAQNEVPRVHFVCPGYMFARNSDGVHMSALQQLIKSHYVGRARKQVLIDAVQNDQFRFVSATASGVTLTVRCNVPNAPLVLDTTSLLAAINYGFVVKDDTGTLTISAIAVSGSTITMTLSRALGANPKFRYALDQLGTSRSLYGPWGNLRESTTDTFVYSGATYPLWHWAPHAELLVSVLP